MREITPKDLQRTFFTAINPRTWTPAPKRHTIPNINDDAENTAAPTT
jgi:hypothetical protein